MRDYIEIETTPSDEDCVQVQSGKDYMPQMRSEAQRYREMLHERFPFIDNVGLLLRIKSNPHDFGSYLSLSIVFDDSKDEQVEAAYFIESNLPEKWSDKEVLNPQFGKEKKIFI